MSKSKSKSKSKSRQTCGLCDGPDEHGRHSHKDASHCGDVGQKFRPRRALAREHTLKVDLEQRRQEFTHIVPYVVQFSYVLGSDFEDFNTISLSTTLNTSRYIGKSLSDNY